MIQFARFSAMRRPSHESEGRRRRESEEKASWLEREALTNIASDKCAFAHLTVNLKTANFQHRIEGCGSARRGLCFGTIPCFACPSSLYLHGFLAVPLLKHGNEARIFFFAAASSVRGDQGTRPLQNLRACGRGNSLP